MAIDIYSLSDKEMKDNGKLNTITQTVTRIIREAFSISGIGLREEDLSPFMFHENSLREKVSVVITGASFSGRKADAQAQQMLCERIRNSLAPVLQREVGDILVTIESPNSKLIDLFLD